MWGLLLMTEDVIVRDDFHHNLRGVCYKKIEVHLSKMPRCTTIADRPARSHLQNEHK